MNYEFNKQILIPFNGLLIINPKLFSTLSCSSKCCTLALGILKQKQRKLVSLAITFNNK